MHIIELDSKELALPKLRTQGNESTIYINGNTLYKVFNNGINLAVKEESIDFIYKNQRKLNGVIMPNEKLFYENNFVGHTMDYYDCVGVDSYFDYSIDFNERYHCCVEFLDIFNRMNSIDAEHGDFHAGNILIDKAGRALIGDCCSIRNKSTSARYKQEQLVVLLSLITGCNLMDEVNSPICISEVIEQIGTSALLDYYYKPSNNLDVSLLNNVHANPEKVNNIIKTYGGL